MTKAGKSQSERDVLSITEVIVTLLLLHHMSVYLSVTYVSVQSDFR